MLLNPVQYSTVALLHRRCASSSAAHRGFPKPCLLLASAFVQLQGSQTKISLSLVQGIVSSFLRLAEAPNQAAFCWDAVRSVVRIGRPPAHPPFPSPLAVYARGGSTSTADCFGPFSSFPFSPPLGFFFSLLRRDVVWLSPGFSRLFASPRGAPDGAPLDVWLRSFVPSSKGALERALSGLRQRDGQRKMTVGVEMAGGRGPGAACVTGEAAAAGPDGGRVVLGTARLLVQAADGTGQQQQGVEQQQQQQQPVSQQQQQQQPALSQEPVNGPGLGSALADGRGLMAVPCSSSPSPSLREWHQHIAEGSGMTPNSVSGGRVGLQGHAKAAASLHYSLMNGGSRDSSQAAAAAGLESSARHSLRRWSETQAEASPLGASSLCLLRAGAGVQGGVIRQAPRRLSQTQAEASPLGTAGAAAASSASAPLCIVIAASKDAEGNTLQRTAAKVCKRMTKLEPRIVRAQGREAVVAAACVEQGGADIVLIDAADAGETVTAIRQRRPRGTLPIVALIDSSYSRRASMDDDEVSSSNGFDDSATKPLSAAVLTSLFGKHVGRLSKDEGSSPREQQPPSSAPNDSEAATSGTAAIRTGTSAATATAATAAASNLNGIRRTYSAPPTAAAKAMETAAATSIGAGDAGPPSSSKLANILIADDSAANQMALKRVVRKVGREVLGAEPSIRTAGDGAEALQAAQQTRFDLVFMDIHMPVMNGIEALQGIRERCDPALPPSYPFPSSTFPPPLLSLPRHFLLLSFPFLDISSSSPFPSSLPRPFLLSFPFLDLSSSSPFPSSTFPPPLLSLLRHFLLLSFPFFDISSSSPFPSSLPRHFLLLSFPFFNLFSSSPFPSSLLQPFLLLSFPFLPSSTFPPPLLSLPRHFLLSSFPFLPSSTFPPPLLSLPRHFLLSSFPFLPSSTFPPPLLSFPRHFLLLSFPFFDISSSSPFPSSLLQHFLLLSFPFLPSSTFPPPPFPSSTFPPLLSLPRPFLLLSFPFLPSSTFPPPLLSLPPFPKLPSSSPFPSFLLQPFLLLFFPSLDISSSPPPFLSLPPRVLIFLHSYLLSTLVCPGVRYSDAEMPVVAVSGTDEAAGPGLSSAGFNEVVFKPISTTQVKSIIQKFAGAAASRASPAPADAAAAPPPAAAAAAATTRGANADAGRKRGRAEDLSAPEAASAGAAAELCSSPKSARREVDAPPAAPASPKAPPALPGAPPSASGAQERQPQWPIFTVAAKNRPATPKPTSISATEAYAPVSYTPISELCAKRIQAPLPPHPQCPQCSQCSLETPQSPSLRRFRFLVVGASLETLAKLEQKVKDTVVQDLGGPQPLVESVVATDEALAATHSHHVDIVFVDLNSPTAGAVIAELRRAFNIASLPIVGLVTQRGDAKRTQEITSELISLKGLNEVDLKPVPRGRIRQIITDNLSCCKHLKPHPTAAPALLPPPRNKNQITCLVAEDDQTAMRMAKRILQKANIDVMEARNGFEAYAAVTGYLQGSLDIVLMDCNMPIKDGWQATRAIRAWEAEHNKCGIPIVAVTANVLEEARGSCLAAGMNEYLTKPVQKLLLLETIARMTGFDCSCASAVSAVSALAPASSMGAAGTGMTAESELTTASRFLSAFGSSTTAATRGTASSKNSASDVIVLETERVSAVAPAGRSCGVLLVDEDLERLLRNKAALEAAGVAVDTAEGGAQALLKLRAGDTAYAAVMVASDLALATGAEETAIEASQGPHDPPRLVLLRETRPRPDLRRGANPEDQRRAPEEAAGLWYRILDLPLRRQGLYTVLADCGLPAPYFSPSDNQEQQLLSRRESLGPCLQLRSLSEMRVLYVDDSKAMRGAVLWMLHAEGLVLAQGMGAVELCNGQNLPLPDRSGDSDKFSAALVNAGDPETAAHCAEALKAVQPGLPVVVVVAASPGSPSSSVVPGAGKAISRDCFGPATVMEAIHEVVGAGAGSLPGFLKDNKGGDEDLRPPVADVGAALLEFEDDWDFVLSLLQCFLSNGYEQISGLVEASFSKPMNLVRLKHLAHMLSGAAASCRILSIAAVCQQLEKLAVARMQAVTDGSRNSRDEHILVLASTTQRLFLEVAEFYSWLRGLQSISVESGLDHTGGNYAHFVKSLNEIAGAATELLHPDEQRTDQQNRAAIFCLLEESSQLLKAAAPHLSAAVESYKQQNSEPVWQELSRELRSLGEEVRGLLYNRPPTR